MTSPASSGPAGALLEGQVGAYYLLSMLAKSEPRGLPGTTISQIQFQRAEEGFPLDDIIIHGLEENNGNEAVLEIQVKRSITFAPQDEVFKKVTSQIGQSYKDNKDSNKRHEFAIAIANSTTKINCSYQEVLVWARKIGDVETFFNRLERRRSSNNDMRVFVNTFRDNLKEAKFDHDNTTIWNLLKRLQILVFDFTAIGSESRQLVIERANTILSTSNSSEANKLWQSLISLSLEIAASGGDRTRDKLLNDNVIKDFSFSLSKNFLQARKFIREASRQALEDIDNHINGIVLTRQKRIDSLIKACDEGRYIEIRGESGVGKSGILRQLAEKIMLEASVIVLSPNRTVKNGWNSMRSSLGFSGSAKELLTDLATDGAAYLFIDNLNSFTEEERVTVKDLVREAANTLNVKVVVTTRHNHDLEESNWLPEKELNILGHTEPVIIDELDKDEIDELCEFTPSLKALLADNHPARKISHNLFRLSRLVSMSSKDSDLFTEVDMAKQWWDTADGSESGRRDRARIIRTLAVNALNLVHKVNVSSHPSLAIDDLIKSKTLLDLGNDNVSFYHDVLKEWAIANILFSDPDNIHTLPLDRIGSSILVRGAELAARMMLERENNGERWYSLLSTVSNEGMHYSWRRSVLVAAVNSEKKDLLNQTSDYMLTNDAALLIELIRIMLSVYVEPISKRLAHIEMEYTDFNVPFGHGWQKLIFWLLIKSNDLPFKAIPDVVEAFNAWCKGTLGNDGLTPYIMQWLYYWLNEIENFQENETTSLRKELRSFLTNEQFDSFKSNLRTGFLLYCSKKPELAVQYLRTIMQLEDNRSAVGKILEFSGTLPNAAPKELAELILTFLIKEPKPDEAQFRYQHNMPFGFEDDKFRPASPNQGPFLDLLINSPAHGLSLIHGIIDYAITFYRKYNKTNNKITLEYNGKQKIFYCIRTYAWSRDKGARAYCVISALMALEVWAHRLIEQGKEIEEVLDFILIQDEMPACYLLVVVDLLLSNWPKSQNALIPFLSCPELLCIDLERYAYDNFNPSLELWGLKSLNKEAKHLSGISTLKKYRSRSYSLKDYIQCYALELPEELRNELTALLQNASNRLGNPDKESDLRDPAFMAIHALNFVDPENWKQQTINLEDGTAKIFHEYIPPASEEEYLKDRRELQYQKNEDINTGVGIKLAVDNPDNSSPQFAEKAITWALNIIDNKSHLSDEDSVELLHAAFIVLRDGRQSLKEKHKKWIESQILEWANHTNNNLFYVVNSSLRNNPLGISFCGIVLLMKDSGNCNDIRKLLEIAAHDNSEGAHGFARSIIVLENIDSRLPKAVLRCALRARIQLPRGRWNEPKEEKEKRSESYRLELSQAIDDEMKWLLNKETAEPNWPEFPVEKTIRGDNDRYVDYQKAALWVASALDLHDIKRRPWLYEIIQTYHRWTMQKNGIHLNQTDEVDHSPIEWNNAYFDLLARCLPILKKTNIEKAILEPIISLPDKSFFDVISCFLRCTDEMYFNNLGVDLDTALLIRRTLVKRMMISSVWNRLARSRSFSIETHIGPALAVILFNDYNIVAKAECYISPQLAERTIPFIPVIEEIVEGAPCLFIAILTLNLVETLSSEECLLFIVNAGQTWLTGYPDNTSFWIDYVIGKRLCLVIEQILNNNPSILKEKSEIQLALESLLSGLIRIGIAEASKLEKIISE